MTSPKRVHQSEMGWMKYVKKKEWLRRLFQTHQNKLHGVFGYIYEAVKATRAHGALHFLSVSSAGVRYTLFCPRGTPGRCISTAVVWDFQGKGKGHRSGKRCDIYRRTWPCEDRGWGESRGPHSNRALIFNTGVDTCRSRGRLIIFSN